MKKIDPSNIIIMGRSIGSGPSTFLASRNKIGMLILIAPFTNLKDAAKYKVGSFLGRFVKQRF